MDVVADSRIGASTSRARTTRPEASHQVLVAHGALEEQITNTAASWRVHGDVVVGWAAAYPGGADPAAAVEAYKVKLSPGVLPAAAVPLVAVLDASADAAYPDIGEPLHMYSTFRVKADDLNVGARTDFVDVPAVVTSTSPRVHRSR